MSAAAIVFGATTPVEEHSTAPSELNPPGGFYSRYEPSAYTLSGSVTAAVDVNPWLARSFQKIADLGKLKPDWDSYGSPKLREETLATVRQLLRSVQREPIGEPSIIPASDGGISVLWESGRRELEVEVLPSGVVEYMRVDEGAPPAHRVLEESVIAANLLPIRSLVRWVMAK